MADLEVRKLEETSTTITLGWTPLPGQEGYLPTIDGNDRLTDGKRHPSMSETANQVKIGKPTDETNPATKHIYGVQILGNVSSGQWPPTPVGDFSWQPQNPKVGVTVTFTVTEPKEGLQYGWDMTLDGVIESTGTTRQQTYVGVGTKTVRLYANNTLVAEHSLQVTAAEPEPEPPPVGDALITRQLNISPGWLSTQDSPSLDATGGWMYPTSPATPYRSPSSGREIARYLLLDPRYKDADGRVGKDEWWFIVERFYPSSYAPNVGDRDPNFHNVAGDAGNAPGAPGGIGWAPGFGSGVSALAFDYNTSTFPRKLAICVLCAWRSQGGFDAELPSERDVWHTYLIHWIAGRTDGSTLRPGAITVWVDGKDTPIINRTGINTVQRAKSPADGLFYTQRWMVLWEGQYTIHLNVQTMKRTVLTRIGNTLEQALADRPGFAVDPNNFDTHYRAYGTFPRSTLTPVEPPRRADEARIPPSLLK
jgi:hypothetical protein